MSALDMFWAAPPIARTITAAAVLLSVPAWMGLIDPYYLVYLPYQIFTLRGIPQIWRFITTFLLTGPKLGMILDPYFLYTYCSSLETDSANFSQPGDFFVYLIFVSGAILLQATLIPIFSTPFLLPALTLALAYTYAQENPNRQMSYFIVTFSSKYLPYAMLAASFVMGSPEQALTQASGLLAAHAYYFLTQVWPRHGGGRQWIQTPQVVKGWFAKPGGVAAGGTQRGAGTAFAARPGGASGGAQAVPQRQGGSWASGFSGGAWGDRGPGRRLGGE